MYSGSIYRNPSTLPCFSLCSSCFRCEDKGKYEKCNRCSGRHDPLGKKDPYDDRDRCRCREGILQIRLKNGQLMVRQFQSSPYGGEVQTDAESQDERDWNSFISEKREQLDDPTYDPIQFEDGSSTTDWVNDQKKGV